MKQSDRVARLEERRGTGGGEPEPVTVEFVRPDGTVASRKTVMLPPAPKWPTGRP